MMKRISIILGIIISLGIILTAANSYVAKQSDLQEVAYRLDVKILQDRVDYLQSRLWSLEDRYVVMRRCLKI